MKKQQMTAFYFEALLLALIFVAMILVLTGVFGEARIRSAEAGRLTGAVTVAANAAEALAAAESPEDLAVLLDEGGNTRPTAEGLEAGYDAEGRPFAGEKPPLLLRLAWERSPEDPALIYGRIRVYAGEDLLYSLDTAAGKEAAA